MNARSAALILGLGYTVAVVVWLLAQLHLTLAMGQTVATVSLQGARLMFLAQAVALAIWIPLWMAPRTHQGISSESSSPLNGRIAGPLLLLIPLPVFTFFWLTTDIAAGTLLAGELCLVAAAVVLTAVSWGVERLSRHRIWNSLGPAAAQIAAVTFAWQFHGQWMQWLAL